MPERKRKSTLYLESENFQQRFWHHMKSFNETGYIGFTNREEVQRAMDMAIADCYKMRVPKRVVSALDAGHKVGVHVKGLYRGVIRREVD